MFVTLTIIVSIIFLPPAAATTSGESAPVIREHPNSLVVKRHEPVTLACKATGTPAPTIEWYKDGERVRETANRIVLTNGDLFILNVMNSKKEKDTGVYHCLAKNVHGKTRSRNATLEMACKCCLLPVSQPTLTLFMLSSTITHFLIIVILFFPQPSRTSFAFCPKMFGQASMRWRCSSAHRRGAFPSPLCCGARMATWWCSATASTCPMPIWSSPVCSPRTPAATSASPRIWRACASRRWRSFRFEVSGGGDECLRRI